MSKTLNTFYSELLEREIELKNVIEKTKPMNSDYKNQKGFADGRLSELHLVIVRVQQLLLEELNNDMKNRKGT